MGTKGKDTTGEQKPVAQSSTVKAHRKGITPTDRESYARYELVSQWLATGWTRTMIHNKADELWGVHWRSADRYVVRAKALFERMATSPVRERVGSGLAFYESILRDPSAEHRDKIRARERIDLLSGAEGAAAHALQRHEVTIKGEDLEESFRAIFGVQKK